WQQPEAVDEDDRSGAGGVCRLDLPALPLRNRCHAESPFGRSRGLRSHMTTRGGTMASSVRDAMTEDPRSIGKSVSVVEAARLMREQDIGSLPITDDEKLVGMITDRDITPRGGAEGGDPKKTL